MSSDIPEDKIIMDLLNNNDNNAAFEAIAKRAANRMGQIDGLTIERNPNAFIVDRNTTFMDHYRDMLPFLTGNEQDDYNYCKGVLSLANLLLLTME